jgi:peptide/nickel transport system substrate-binding protein
MRLLAFASLPLTFLAALPAAAQELKVGVASEVTSIDPHFHNVGPNNSLRRHIFQGLVTTDEAQKIVPSSPPPGARWTRRPGSSSSVRA